MNAESHRTLEEDSKLASGLDPALDSVRDPIAKCDVEIASLRAKPGEAKMPKGVQVRLTVQRSRSIQPEDACCKFIVECLRHCGAIPDDSLQHVEVCVRQAKAPAAHLQGTLIELIPIE
jgi:hypothetical protein